MTSNMSAEDDRRERYLWDPGAESDPEVRRLEGHLASARFDPRRRPLALPSLRPHARTRFRASAVLATAATLLIAIGVGEYWSWR